MSVFNSSASPARCRVGRLAARNPAFHSWRRSPGHTIDELAVGDFAEADGLRRRHADVNRRRGRGKTRPSSTSSDLSAAIERGARRRSAARDLLAAEGGWPGNGPATCIGEAPFVRTPMMLQFGFNRRRDRVELVTAPDRRRARSENPSPSPTPHRQAARRGCRPPDPPRLWPCAPILMLSVRMVCLSTFQAASTS